MHTRNDPMTNTANDRSFIKCSASSPSTSRTLTRPVTDGGVCGSSRQNTASATDPAAASCIGRPVASTPIVPTTRPATIQPIVPSTRTGGNSRPGSRIWRNESELVSASVGM